MNDEITVLSIENIDYVVLEKIEKENHEYLILFEDENPKNILLVEYFKKTSQVEEIEDQKLINEIFTEFFNRHPDIKKKCEEQR